MSKKIESDQINQIRDIVFGKEMETYESKFSDLQKDLENKFEQMMKQVGNVEFGLNEKFVEESLDVNEAITQLQTNLDIENEKNLSLISSAKQALNQKNELLARDLIKMKKEFEQKIINLKSELLSVFWTEINEIKQTHMSKASFAEALLELSFQFSDEVDKKNKLSLIKGRVKSV